jgi:hypothetical protein
MLKSLKAPYQHSSSTQHYLGIENQYAKKLAMITISHHVNQGFEYQLICTRCTRDIAATCMAWSSWWENWKLDNYHCVTWRRVGTPRDLAPMTNHRDICPSMDWQNQPIQSCHIDVKHELGEPRFGVLHSPQESKERWLQDTDASPMVSKYSLHTRRGTHTVSNLSYSTWLVTNGDLMKYL